MRGLTAICCRVPRCSFTTTPSHNGLYHVGDSGLHYPCKCLFLRRWVRLGVPRFLLGSVWSYNFAVNLSVTFT